MSNLLKLENRIAAIQASKMVGICYLDEEGVLVQVLDDDPNLRQSILDYYRQRMQEPAAEEQNWRALRSTNERLKRQRLVPPD